MKKIVLSLFMLGFILFTTNAVAGGFDNPSVGLKGYTMGCSLTGAVDDASAVYYNPGGLAFNRQDKIYMETYGYVIFTGFEYEGPGGTDESDEVFFIPGFFISKTYDDWAVGFGFYIPFAGGGVKYENFQGSGYDLEAAAGFTALTSSFSYKLRDDFSLGIGISLYIGEMTNNFFDMNYLSYVETEYDGFAGYGGNIGLMYKPNKDFSIGFTIELPVEIEMDGEMKTNNEKYDANVDFTLPFQFKLGFGYNLNENFSLSFEIDYMLWDDLDKITFTTAGRKTSTKTYYKNTFLFGAGVDYKFHEKTSIRAGLYYTQRAAKDEGMNPGSLDVDLLSPSIGIAYQMSKKAEICLTGFYVYGIEEKYNGQSFSQKTPVILAGARFNF